MDEMKRDTERDMPALKPLALSRPTVVAVVGIAILLWTIAFFLWWQGELDKWLFEE